MKTKEDFKLLLKCMMGSTICVFTVLLAVLALSTCYMELKIYDNPKYELVSSLIEDVDGPKYFKVATTYTLEKLPESHLQELKDAGYKIVISSDDLYDYHDNFYKGDMAKSDIAGMIVYAQKTIYLKQNPVCLSQAALHEVGHAMDYLNGDISETEEFKNCFDTESKNARGYAKTSESEYFADMYSLQFQGMSFLMFQFEDLKNTPLFYDADDFPSTTEFFANQNWW